MKVRRGVTDQHFGPHIMVRCHGWGVQVRWLCHARWSVNVQGRAWSKGCGGRNFWRQNLSVSGVCFSMVGWGVVSNSVLIISSISFLLLFVLLICSCNFSLFCLDAHVLLLFLSWKKWMRECLIWWIGFEFWKMEASELKFDVYEVCDGVMKEMMNMLWRRFKDVFMVKNTRSFCGKNARGWWRGEFQVLWFLVWWREYWRMVFICIMMVWCYEVESVLRGGVYMKITMVIFWGRAKYEVWK